MVSDKEMFGLNDKMLRASFIDQPSTNLSSIPDFKYDVALSKDCFFNPNENMSFEDILKRIKGLARIAKEVRIYPLSDDEGKLSSLVGPVLLSLQQENYGTEIREVSPANPMLRVWAQSCVVK